MKEKKKRKEEKRRELVISYRDHKTEMFFLPRAKPEVRNTSRFMVECTNVTFYSDGFIKTRFGPAGRLGILFVPGTKRIPNRPARENGEIWPEAHDRKRVCMNPEG